MAAVEHWDLVVIGGGPAGSVACLAALHERPDASVLLLDRADFPRDKCCGDGIAPHVLDVLAEVGASGVADELRRAHSPIRTLHLAMGEQHVARPMRRPALVVPRYDFDARLVAAAAQAGATVRRHRVRQVTVNSRGVLIDGAVHARVTIGADGDHSLVAASIGSRRPGRRAIGLRGYAPTSDQWAGHQVIRFGQDRRPSYAWAFDRGDGWSNVGYGEVLRSRRDRLSRAAMLDRVEELLPGAAAQARDWRGHHLPLSTIRWGRVQPDGPVLLAGDAAGHINPMTGEGIYYAALSGALAGRTAARLTASATTVGDPGHDYRAAVRRRLRTNLVSTAVAGRAVSVPGLLRTGLRAAGADQELFDDLVELGLGAGHLTPRVAASLVRQR